VRGAMRATSPLCLQSYLQQLIQPLEKLSLSQEGGGRPDDVGGAKDEVSGPAILRDGEVHGVGGGGEIDRERAAATQTRGEEEWRVEGRSGRTWMARSKARLLRP
jgi:hypothetical protein